MKFNDASLLGVYTIELKMFGDERGFFARQFCANEFHERGLMSNVVQINNSLSATKGTLRGMHYQLAPNAETKVVRCIRGSLYDVLLDLRADSPTYGQTFGANLSADNRLVMYCPKGCAHGFVTLEDDTEVIYLVDASYAPEAERIVRWNDPKFNIQWPIQPVVLSDKDAGAPDFDPKWHLGVG